MFRELQENWERMGRMGNQESPEKLAFPGKGWEWCHNHILTAKSKTIHFPTIATATPVFNILLEFSTWSSNYGWVVITLKISFNKLWVIFVLFLLFNVRRYCFSLVLLPSCQEHLGGNMFLDFPSVCLYIYHILRIVISQEHFEGISQHLAQSLRMNWL